MGDVSSASSRAAAVNRLLLQRGAWVDAPIAELHVTPLFVAAERGAVDALEAVGSLRSSL